jgi:ankyrin repeat protein
VAAYHGHKKIVELLLEWGADVDGGSYRGPQGTPLQAAAFEGDIEIVKLLLNKNADPNIKGGMNVTALHAASYRGFTDIVRLLITHGANVNCEGGDHVTALGAADFAAHTDIVELLIKHGAKPLRTERSPSKLDNGTIVALQRIEEEVGKGRRKGPNGRSGKESRSGD